MFQTGIFIISGVPTGLGAVKSVGILIERGFNGVDVAGCGGMFVGRLGMKHLCGMAVRYSDAG